MGTDRRVKCARHGGRDAEITLPPMVRPMDEAKMPGMLALAGWSALPSVKKLAIGQKTGHSL